MVCSVPQESIQESFLFLVHIYDLPQFLKESGSHLYADDTCVFFQAKDNHKIEDVLNKKLSTLYEWLVDNKLSIHF